MHPNQSFRFSVAPMMDWTDRRCRAFHRLLTRRARLYTEMVTADAVVFGPRERLIGFDEGERPVALQLGGSEPKRLAEDALFALAAAVKAAGAVALVVHARKAWLEGLSPKDNRSVPPLDYPLVYALKSAHPDWPIILNGGVADLMEARAHLAHVDGIMVGRAAYQNPELLLGVDPAIFGEAAPFDDPFDALEAFMAVIARGLARGERLHDYARHLIGL